MSNVNMRKAISLAMNRSALTDNILADGSAPGFGLVADGMSGDGEKTFRELNGDVSPYDPEQAKEYYDKAVEALNVVEGRANPTTVPPEQKQDKPVKKHRLR